MTLPEIAAGPRRRLLARLAANGLGQAAATVAAALLVKAGFEQLIAAPGAITLSVAVPCSVGILAVAGVAAWLRLVERVDAERLGQAYVNEVRLTLFRRLNGLSPRAMQRRSTGGVLLRFVGDLTALRQWVSLGVARLAVGGLVAALAVAALAGLDWAIGATVAAVIVAGAGVSLRLGPRLQRTAREARRRRSRLAANINEKIASLAVVQAYGQGGRERKRVAKQSERLMRAMVSRSAVIGRLRAVAEATPMVATAGVLVTGALGVAAGRTEPGTVVAAITVAGLLAPRLRDLGRVYEYWNGAQVSRRKIEAFLGRAGGSRGRAAAPALKRGPGHLVFERVSVEGCLEQVSAELAPGARVAVVGPNGAGKSTLLAAAARLVRPFSGRVLLDGQDIARHSLRSVRRALAMVGPDLPLLRGSIDKNLRYGRRGASDAEVALVVALCGVDRIAAELPQGLDTRVAEGGVNLSAGQRRCIALARALLRAPRVLLLDEVEANLDPRAAAAVERVLEAFPGPVLMVTHDPRRLRAASEVWHLEGGRLVERGAPDELLRGDGPTARLFRPAPAEAA